VKLQPALVREQEYRIYSDNAVATVGSGGKRVRGSEQVELNQGAAQGNHKRVRLDPRAIDRGIPNDQIEITALQKIPVARRRLIRARLVDDAPMDTSEIRLRSFALAVVGMLCATVIGFVSEIRPLNPNSPDYGYDEALGTQTSSLSSASFLSNSDDDGAAIPGASKDGLDRLGVSAIVAHVAASSAAKLHAKAIGGNHVE
jgi:hypothetical protein